MNKPYFVMLYNQKLTCFVPLMDDEENLMMFSDIQSAYEAGQSTTFGSHFGFEIFGEGEGADAG